MKATKLTKAALLAGSLSFLAGSAFSQTAVSGAGGYTTLNLGAGFNLVGLSLLEPIAVSGTVDSEDGDTMTDADPGDLTAIISDGDLVEITSGPAAGTVAEISNVTATSFDVAGGLGGDGAGADYNVRPASTVGETFGDLNPSGGAFPDDTTDVVWLPAAGGQFTKLFITSAGEWKNADAPFGPDLASTPIFYPDGMFVEVKSDAKDVVVTGMVKTSSTVVAADSGFNLVGVTPPVGSNLGNSGLAADLNPSGGAFPDDNTDVVWVVDAGAAGGFAKYFQTSAGEWKNADAPFGPDLSDTALSSGIFLQRAGESTTANLGVPDFYENL